MSYIELAMHDIEEDLVKKNQTNCEVASVFERNKTT